MKHFVRSPKVRNSHDDCSTAMTNCFYVFGFDITKWSAESQLIATGRLQKASHWYQFQISELFDSISFYLLTKYICFTCVSGCLIELTMDFTDFRHPINTNLIGWRKSKRSILTVAPCNKLLESDWNTISLIRSKSVHICLFTDHTHWIGLRFNLSSMLIVTPEYLEQGGQGHFSPMCL